MNWLGMDIGGANIKLADGKGYASSYAFSLWKNYRQLAQELRTCIAEAPASDHLAVTMTGELADCFENRVQGVQFILQAVREAADRRHTRVYLRNGHLVTPEVALQRPQLVAAANWHALACFAGRFAKREMALLVDIGSTTSDLVPLQQGKPIARGETDLGRLLHGELVYTGVERSPVCAIVQRVPYRGKSVMLAQELFATARDIYLTLGDLLEDAQQRNTADGRPATKAAALVRLARAICADGEEFQWTDAQLLAKSVAEAQCVQLTAAGRHVLEAMPAAPTTVILAGQGEFLARRVCDALFPKVRHVALSQEVGPVASRCGPAHALAVLAREASGL